MLTMKVLVYKFGDANSAAYDVARRALASCINSIGHYVVPLPTAMVQVHDRVAEDLSDACQVIEAFTNVLKLGVGLGGRPPQLMVVPGLEPDETVDPLLEKLSQLCKATSDILNCDGSEASDEPCEIECEVVFTTLYEGGENRVVWRWEEGFHGPGFYVDEDPEWPEDDDAGEDC